jgi:signal transduction histidine kinase
MKKIIVSTLFIITFLDLFSQSFSPSKYQVEEILQNVKKIDSAFLEVKNETSNIKGNITNEVPKVSVSMQKIDIKKINANFIEPDKLFEQPKEQVKLDTLSLQADKKFLQNLPKSYDNLEPKDLKKIASDIENQLQRLIKEKEELLKQNASTEVIEEKNTSIKSLGKEKTIVDLTIKSDELNTKATGLEIQKDKLKKFLIGAIVALVILVLAIIAILQRKTIKVQDKEIDSQLKDIIKKNSFLDFAARVIRHDMHSGINTYIPRGLSSLEKRLTDEQIKQLKIESPLQLIRDGLIHTQKVYKIVYEFTNLVKQNAVLDKHEVSLNEVIEKFITKTSYINQVEVSQLPTIKVNEILFWNSIDNLIKNGIKYNDNENKKVKIYMEEDNLIVEDNGRGFSQEQFEEYLYSPEKGEESNLGLKISYAILKEHGFEVSCQKLETGTKFKIKVK